MLLLRIDFPNSMVSFTPTCPRQVLTIRNSSFIVNPYLCFNQYLLMRPLHILCAMAAIYTSCTKDDVYTKATTPTTREDATAPVYKLAWSDEFDYSGLPDSAKWGYEHGYVRNNETQYYQVARLQNSQVKNGHLIITALNDSFQNHPVSSASVITKGKMQFLYGKIVVRAKMPVGAGSWPAIWTLGINRDTVDWPNCGEIDIVEWVGRAPQVILGSMYMPGPFGYSTRVTSYNVGDASTLSAQYHTYSIEWDSTQIKYFYDDFNYATYKSSQMTARQWAPFKKPHYLLLNLAIGGKSGGPIDYTKFPFTCMVDYVRYYQVQ